MLEYNREFAEILYNTPTQCEKLSGLWVTRTGRNRAKPNYSVGPKVIECYSLHAVKSGSVALTYGSRTVLLQKGSVFCLFPGQIYSYRLADSSVSALLRMSWLAFSGSQSELLLRRLGLDVKRPYLQACWKPEHEKQLERIQNILRSRKPGCELTLQADLYRLFDLLQHTADAEQPGGDGAWLQRCVHYMESRYADGITVADAVRVSGKHRTYVYQAFRNAYGVSPMNYLIRLRMQKAAEKLTGSAQTVSGIALAVGYPDLFSFSRAFRKYYGCSPTQYRSRPVN